MPGFPRRGHQPLPTTAHPHPLSPSPGVPHLATLWHHLGTLTPVSARGAPSQTHGHPPSSTRDQLQLAHLDVQRPPQHLSSPSARLCWRDPLRPAGRTALVRTLSRRGHVLLTVFPDSVPSPRRRANFIPPRLQRPDGVAEHSELRPVCRRAPRTAGGGGESHPGGMLLGCCHLTRTLAGPSTRGGTNRAVGSSNCPVRAAWPQAPAPASLSLSSAL